ncbi:MAG: FAD binding domain-containing protein [Anaeromicrobium sp.]|jgi:carbon-monoxide dehydrogenase medium subunit|uniref:FAD binding domain-containing protein n=1 Tax=Anaeromicrobium sp. TaxID=1929132 RepID=UPI0025E1C235|nr:FAD binding domain-containing protein [Anaeromicrobium sp.]MCT4593881.1 FAD binding domain-containing protein [Anaeromicrobium sp.]
MIGFQYYRPDNLEIASEMLIKNGIYTHILNGGTDLIERIKDETVKADILVDIKGIETLHEIDFCEDDGLYIGACVTLKDLINSSIVKEKYRILIDSMESIGTERIRKRGTVIGNICNGSYLGDTLTTLIILDTEVMIYSYSRGERQIPIDDFLTWTGTTSLKRGEIVRGIKIPYNGYIDGGFIKIYKNKNQLSIANLSIGKINDEYRIAFYMPGTTPIRIREVEEFLNGREVTEYDIYKVAKIAEKKLLEKDSFNLLKKEDIKQIKDLIKYVFLAFSKKPD